MENNVIVRKWTEMAGIAAITLDAGKKIGTLEDFYLDAEKSTVFALVIKTGLFGHRALPVGAISGMGVDAVTFTNEEQLIKENEISSTANLLPGKGLLSYRVLSESGTLIGEIGNILLDVTNPTAMKIDGYQLATGGLRERFTGKYQAFAAGEVLRYGQDVVILPNNIAQALLKP